MPMEISADLIDQLKISLRKGAKLSSFDPVAGYSFPSLPTSDEAIAELDASAPYLRCRNCKAKLLRGIESLICVFCGNHQRTTDNPPHPINFTSTFAYKWFLGSLYLDGSEMVEPLKETNGSSRGAKGPVAKGIAVSKFLDFDFQCSAIEDNCRPGHGQSVQKNKNPLNLGGLNLDDFFVQGRGHLSKVVTPESKPLEDDDFKDPRSLSLFDTVNIPGLLGSQQHDNVGLFDKQDAHKSVSSQEHENLSLFAVPHAQDSVSLAEQGNFGFFEGKDAQHSFKDDENLSFFEGKDAQRNSSFKENDNFGLFEGKYAQRTSSSRDDESFGLFEDKEAQRNTSPKEDENLGLFEGTPSSNAGLNSFDDKIVASSSDWNSDFQAADHNLFQEKISGDPFVSSPVDLAAHMDSVFGSGKELLYAKPADSSTVLKADDWLRDDLFSNVSGEAPNNDSAGHDKNEGQVVGGNGSSSMDIDWIGDDLWQTSEKKSIEKTTTDVNDDDDDWNDFASSANSKTPPNNPISQTMESSQHEIFDGEAQVKNDLKEQSFDERQNTGTNVMTDIGKGREDDLFGNWDSFTSSTIPQTSLQPPTNHGNLSGEKSPEMNLFGANNNHRDLDVDSLPHSDFFSESIGGKTNSAEAKVMPSGTSTLERTSDDGKDQTLDLVVGTTTIAPNSKSDVAAELMAQMHDLSFMLETKLSVPPISKTE